MSDDIDPHRARTEAEAEVRAIHARREKVRLKALSTKEWPPEVRSLLDDLKAQRSAALARWQVANAECERRDGFSVPIPDYGQGY